MAIKNKDYLKQFIDYKNVGVPMADIDAYHTVRGDNGNVAGLIFVDFKHKGWIEHPMQTKTMTEICDIIGKHVPCAYAIAEHDVEYMYDIDASKTVVTRTYYVSPDKEHGKWHQTRYMTLKEHIKRFEMYCRKEF